MAVLHIDHIYRETHHWVDSVAWWTNLGFVFVQQWGEDPHRAGRLRSGDTNIVLAEVASGDRVRESVFMTTYDLLAMADRTGRDIVETHWGTSMISVEDPDGRTYNFETRNEIE